MAQVGLAWLPEKGVDGLIVGTTSVEHLVEAVEAIEVDLPSSDIEFLEGPYGAVGVMGRE